MMKSQRLTEMPERELHEDRGAERQKLVIKRHVLLMKPGVTPTPTPKYPFFISGRAIL